jgi:flagellar hook-basal body complex protein FliE
MLAPILPISAPLQPSAIKPVGETSAGTGFQDIFTHAVGQVESAGETATTSVQQLLSGDTEDLHTAVLATQRAELAFEMFQQVRNKVVSAYQEIMRMQM